jgi:inward rectifier potassium channel
MHSDAMSTKHRRKGLTSMVGHTEVTRLGVPRFTLQDTYHRILRMSWLQFFAAAVAVYLLANLVFACAYRLGDHAINNADSFSDCFFFSVETLATVGYGGMSPATFYGHCVATMEIITGMLSMAVITSLVFARFSKPTARILFSRTVVITPFEGVPTLMVRVANQRRSFIIEASASLVLLRDEQTADGHQLRRFHDLKLQRARSPMFALSWQIMHRIDETSPLHGVSAQDFKDGDMRLVLTISGVDETFAATVTARTDYTHEHLRHGERFVDIFDDGDHPRHVYLDFGRFHETQKD